MAQQKQQRKFFKTVRGSRLENGECQKVHIECYDLELATMLDSNEDPQKKVKEGEIIWIASMSIDNFLREYAKKEVNMKMTNGDVAKLDFKFDGSVNLTGRFFGAKQIIFEFKQWFDKNLSLFANHQALANEINQALMLKEGYDVDEFEFKEEPQEIIEILKNSIEKLKKGIRKRDFILNFVVIKEIDTILEQIPESKNIEKEAQKAFIKNYMHAQEKQKSTQPMVSSSASPQPDLPVVKMIQGTTLTHMVCDSKAFLDAIDKTLFPDDNPQHERPKWDNGFGGKKSYSSFIAKLSPEELDKLHKDTQNNPREFSYRGKTYQCIVKKSSSDLSNNSFITDILEIKLSIPTVQQTQTTSMTTPTNALQVSEYPVITDKNTVTATTTAITEQLIEKTAIPDNPKFDLLEINNSEPDKKKIEEVTTTITAPATNITTKTVPLASPQTPLPGIEAEKQTIEEYNVRPQPEKTYPGCMRFEGIKIFNSNKTQKNTTQFDNPHTIWNEKLQSYAEPFTVPNYITEAAKKEVVNIGGYLIKQLENHENDDFKYMRRLIRMIMIGAGLNSDAADQIQSDENDIMISLRRLEEILPQLPDYEEKELHIMFYKNTMEDIADKNNNLKM